MQTLFIGDLHLYDHELRTTKGMVANNELMLSNLYTYIKDRPNIMFVVFAGDIQHKVPSAKNLYDIALWKRWFTKLGELMADRMQQLTTKVTIEDRPSPYTNSLVKKPYPLFTLKGNHDYKTTLRTSTSPEVNANAALSDLDFTFYDSLIYEGLMQNPRSITYRDNGFEYYMQFRNYGEAAAEVPQTVLDNEDIVIGFYHDSIKTVASAGWLKLDPQAVDGSQVLANVDFGIMGHIHDYAEPIKIKTDAGNMAVLMQNGAMARTQADEPNRRDFGYCTLIDTTDKIRFSQVTIPVLPSDEYFDLQKIATEVRKRNRHNDQTAFKDALTNTTADNFDPLKDIAADNSLDADVKAKALSAINLATDDPDIETDD